MINFFYRACARRYRVAVFGLLALFWLPVSHAAPFSSAGGTGAPGHTVSIVIDAAQLSLWNVSSFDVGYDPTVLDFLPEEDFGAEPGFLGDAFSFFDESGYALLSVFSPEPDFSGSGALVRLSFNILPDAAPGATALNFDCLSQCDPQFDYVFDAFSTTITVAQDTSQPVPEPHTPLLLLAGLGGLMMARKARRPKRC